MSFSSSESEFWRLEPSGSSPNFWESEESCSSTFSEDSSDSTSESCYGCGQTLLSQATGPAYALVHRPSSIATKDTSSLAACRGVEREVFHPECLVCWQCLRKIGEEDVSCWWSKGRLTCKDCKTSLTRCQRCNGEITRDSWVHLLEGRAFHLTCLTCTLCRRQLAQGEACGLRGDRLVCASHLGDNPRSGGEDSDDSLGPSASKRNRTSFSNQQVSVLQQCFYTDPNPDGNDLEKIANKAKLSKRVTQVWFQNARARRKKQHHHSSPQHFQISPQSVDFAPFSSANSSRLSTTDEEVRSEYDCLNTSSRSAVKENQAKWFHIYQQLETSHKMFNSNGIV